MIIMKNYLRNLTLAASLLLSSSASALEVELVSKTETPWTLDQQNTLVVYGFGVEEHHYRIRLSNADVVGAAQNYCQFLDDLTSRIYDIERQGEKGSLRFTPEAIKRGILRQHPKLKCAPLQPRTYDLNLKQIYGWGLMSTT